MCFPEPVDRNVSSFLTIVDFISFRKTCKVHYHDKEAFEIRSKYMPFTSADLDAKKTIALHYLISWALRFKERIGSMAWYQRIVDWLQYKPSIEIMYLFFCKQNLDFLFEINLSKLCSRRRFIWWRLWHRDERLHKERLFKPCFNNENWNERPTKRQ